MAVIKYTCPPQPATGAGTFSDNLVGFQLVTGGGLTQANFEFVTGVSEKSNRTFTTGNFSQPINLDSLGLNNVGQSKAIFEKNYKVYPNYDLSQITNFTLYGSMVKRISSAVQTIISKYPAALESTFLGLDFSTGATAINIVYNSTYNTTKFELQLSRIRNPFEIDFTVNSTRNLELREIQVSPLRNMTLEYAKYSLYYKGVGYDVLYIVPTQLLDFGTLSITVNGNPFSGQTTIFEDFVIRPNDIEVNKVFSESLDPVEQYLLNRNVAPIYTATFQVPKQNDDGTYFLGYESVTWPLSLIWNLDIQSKRFTEYLEILNEISSNFDSNVTNLISRFLITESFKDFDTDTHKMEKILQLYGRSFDEIKKFIDALAYMNSVNYNVGNDIPSQLLKNLAQTLGWEINMSPITEVDFLNSVFGDKNTDKSKFTGAPQKQTPDELNFQYYRNLILNSAYLFKSKGTRKSIEILLRLVGAPEALVEFNEFVYVADQRINLKQFETQFFNISGGTYVQELPTYESGYTFSIMGVEYTGFTTQTVIKDVNLTREEYPMDDEGYPQAPIDTENYYFQIGSGWFEQTPKHRAPEVVDFTNSVFTGNNPNYQTKLAPYTYGQTYLNRFRQFPFMSLGYNLTAVPDNNKSWTDNEIGLRSNLDGGLNARYYTESEKLVLNVKNVDIFMNVGQPLAYDVWYMSRKYNYPIPNEGLFYIQPTYCNPNPNVNYPNRFGVDWTEINPQPKRKTFFEFAQTFWVNTINVRNRLYIFDGKTGGYPTLQSIFWKYLQSQETINIPNDNFSYQTMIDYVNGMGDYWIRLIEQMVPATTIWNTGVKYENSIFHRQKFVWRRQAGCQIIPIPCNPCSLTTNIFNYDCNIETVECNKYPWMSNPVLTDFNSVLGLLLQNYLDTNGILLGDCDLSSLLTEWFVDLRINGMIINQYSFFSGIGYIIPGLSAPTVSDWDNALTIVLDDLVNIGYSYYFTENNTVVIYNSICSTSEQGVNFQLNVGINFSIFCGN